MNESLPCIRKAESLKLQELTIELLFCFSHPHYPVIVIRRYSAMMFLVYKILAQSPSFSHFIYVFIACFIKSYPAPPALRQWSTRSNMEHA